MIDQAADDAVHLQPNDERNSERYFFNKKGEKFGSLIHENAVLERLKFAARSEAYKAEQVSRN